jgi:alcohol-forming fatty acyl-CoA reductase
VADVVDSSAVTEPPTGVGTTDPPVADALAGRRVLLTGATGFVGEALLERLLHDLPDTSVVVIARPRGETTAEQRVAALLDGPAFGRLRDRIGVEATHALLGTRLEVLSGDLAAVPDLPSDLDVVIHCAGEVSFDPAIDEGFATNVQGALNLLAAIDASGSQPHYVHVSTAYVAGVAQGVVPEGRLDHDIDWRAEQAAAALVRDRLEADSRSAERLAELVEQATRTHGAEGPTAIARQAETLRREWLDTQLVDAGRQRAHSLGWTDCYTFTKAMAERAVEQTAAHRPVTVVRPSIIESALEQPFPGWIEGFKMAEPIILAYGRGDFPDFPGLPDGIIDIIPVDLVVSATLVAAARLPRPGEPAYYTICSGARNPLTFHRLYELVRGYFVDHPLITADRGAIPAAVWSWPGTPRVATLLGAGERLARGADRVLTALPRSPRTRSWARSLDRQTRKLQFMRRYFDLYRPYADAGLRYSDDRTLALHRALDPGDVATWGFDVSTLDWHHYLVEVHVPTVVEPLRGYTAIRLPPPEPQRHVADGGSGVVAVFDMDGTVLDTNVVSAYLGLRLPELGTVARGRELAGVAAALPGWLRSERRDRGEFLRAVYRRYEGADLADLERLVDEEITPALLGRTLPGAVRAAREHRAAGHRVVLVTGAIRPLTRPVAPLFDEISAAELQVDASGRCTGLLADSPLVGESRAAWLKARARAEGWDLSASYAYADSVSDLPLLRAVGHPVAVDPDVSLSRVARRQKWPVEVWQHGRHKRAAAGAPA